MPLDLDLTPSEASLEKAVRKIFYNKQEMTLLHAHCLHNIALLLNLFHILFPLLIKYLKAESGISWYYLGMYQSWSLRWTLYYKTSYCCST